MIASMAKPAKPKQKPAKPKYAPVTLDVDLQCSFEYAGALERPMETENLILCPVDPNAPGEFRYVVARKTFDVTLSSTGESHIYLFPAAANDLPIAWVSDPTTDTTVPFNFQTSQSLAANMAGTAGSGKHFIMTYATSLPFSAAEMFSQASVPSNSMENGMVYSPRPVFTGVRARFTGSASESSGSISYLVDSEGTSVMAADPSTIFGATRVALNERQTVEFGVIHRSVDTHRSFGTALDNNAVFHSFYPTSKGAMWFDTGTTAGYVQTQLAQYAGANTYGNADLHTPMPYAVISVEGALAGGTVQIEMYMHVALYTRAPSNLPLIRSHFTYDDVEFLRKLMDAFERSSIVPPRQRLVSAVAKVAKRVGRHVLPHILKRYPQVAALAALA